MNFNASSDAPNTNSWLIFSKRWKNSIKDPPSVPGDQGGDPKPHPKPQSPAGGPAKSHHLKILMAATAQSPPETAETEGAPGATKAKGVPSQEPCP